MSLCLPPWKQPENKDFSIATPCVQLTPIEYQSRIAEYGKSGSHGTLVTFDQTGKALYFSRALIPLPHNPSTYAQSIQSAEKVPCYRHIGLYAFRYPALQKYVSLPATPLEIVEQLEQLRALEHGMSIKVVCVDYQGRTHWSVDHPQDIVIVEKIIQKEGELVAQIPGTGSETKRGEEPCEVERGISGDK